MAAVLWRTAREMFGPEGCAVVTTTMSGAVAICRIAIFRKEGLLESRWRAACLAATIAYALADTATATTTSGTTRAVPEIPRGNAAVH